MKVKKSRGNTYVASRSKLSLNWDSFAWNDSYNKWSLLILVRLKWSKQFCKYLLHLDAVLSKYCWAQLLQPFYNCFTTFSQLAFCNLSAIIIRPSSICSRSSFYIFLLWVRLVLCWVHVTRWIVIHGIIPKWQKWS